MRKRASGAVRVVSVCARCGARPDIYPFRIERGLAGHELAVCRSCDVPAPEDPTFMERCAIGVDPANPLDVMEFVERFVADPARVRRSARYFLGGERYDVLVPECRAFVEAGRARREELRSAAPAWDLAGYDDDDDDGDPFYGENDDDD